MSAVPHTPAISSRLPAVGTTIFSVMSALAQQHQAVNLGQGFPDFPCDPALVEAVHQVPDGNEHRALRRPDLGVIS